MVPSFHGEQSTEPSTLDTQLHPQSPKKVDGPSNIDPGTNTVPAPAEGKNIKCTIFFGCIEDPILAPGASKPMVLRDDEICRNGIDDNDNGRVDEEPYCVLLSLVNPRHLRRIRVLKGENSSGPSPFGP